MDSPPPRRALASIETAALDEERHEHSGHSNDPGIDFDGPIQYPRGRERRKGGRNRGDRQEEAPTVETIEGLLPLPLPNGGRSGQFDLIRAPRHLSMGKLGYWRSRQRARTPADRRIGRREKNSKRAKSRPARLLLFVQSGYSDCPAASRAWAWSGRIRT